ncbi:hypothetical protein [Streptomyces sp. 8L]|nr:hypothetical protein [Streptomyces sp. 8L]
MRTGPYLQEGAGPEMELPVSQRQERQRRVFDQAEPPIASS